MASRLTVEDKIYQKMTGPAVWGKSDCLLCIADILHDLGLPDFGTPYRGRYETREEALVLIGGSVGAFLHRFCNTQGWPEISPRGALPGDIGLLIRPDALETGCIMGTSRWHWRSEVGAGIGGRAYTAWRIPLWLP